MRMWGLSKSGLQPCIFYFLYIGFLDDRNRDDGMTACMGARMCIMRSFLSLSYGCSWLGLFFSVLELCFSMFRFFGFSGFLPCGYGFLHLCTKRKTD